MNAVTTHETLQLVEAAPLDSRPPALQQVSELAPTSPAGMMMAMLDRGASLEQIEKMMDLQERHETRQAEKAFNDAMAAFKGDAIAIIKRKHVHFVTQKGTTNYKHAELSDVIEAVGPALSRLGFSWRWDTEQSNGHMTVTCILRHKLGHSEKCSMSGPYDASGGKNALQAVISTKTYLERHTLKAICGVAEKGEDNDGRGADANEDDAPSWASKAAEATSVDELTKIVREGTQALQAAKDRDGYRALREAAQARRALLTIGEVHGT